MNNWISNDTFYFKRKNGASNKWMLYKQETLTSFKLNDQTYIKSETESRTQLQRFWPKSLRFDNCRNYHIFRENHRHDVRLTKQQADELKQLIVLEIQMEKHVR